MEEQQQPRSASSKPGEALPWQPSSAARLRAAAPPGSGSGVLLAELVPVEERYD